MDDVPLMEVGYALHDLFEYFGGFVLQTTNTTINNVRIIGALFSKVIYCTMIKLQLS